jgi:hypothetical protein
MRTIKTHVRHLNVALAAFLMTSLSMEQAVGDERTRHPSTVVTPR